MDDIDLLKLGIPFSGPGSGHTATPGPAPTEKERPDVIKTFEGLPFSMVGDAIQVWDFFGVFG